MNQPPEIEAKFALFLRWAEERGMSPTDLAIDDRLNGGNSKFWGWDNDDPLSQVFRMMVCARYLPDGFEESLRRKSQERLAGHLLRASDIFKTWADMPQEERIDRAPETLSTLTKFLDDLKSQA
jgi:hypothetical protein